MDRESARIKGSVHRHRHRLCTGGYARDRCSREAGNVGHRLPHARFMLCFCQALMCHPSPRKFDCTRSYAETEIHGYTHGNVSGREIQEIPSKQGRKDSSSCRQGGGDGLGHKTHDEVVRTSGMMCPV